MGEAGRPGFGTRMRAAIAREQSAEVLEVMRDAGRAVYEELAYADAVRQERKVAGASSWDSRPAVASHLVATHNAVALQMLAEELLDSDYRSHPRTRGYVPEPIFTQVWSWLSAVPQWLSRARQARSNPDYDLRHELQLPVDLPPWRVEKETMARFVEALATVAPRLRQHTEYAVFALTEATTPERAGHANRLRQLLAAADTAVDYVAGVRRESPAELLLKSLWEQLSQAVAIYFQVGQLAEFPASASDAVRPAGVPPPPVSRQEPRFDPRSVPGGSRFDPWCLTDPETLPHWQSQQHAWAELDQLWAADPNPAATLQVRAEIDAAEATGGLVRVKLAAGTGATCYFRCPWSPIYEVRRPVTVHRTRFAVLQQFAFDVSAEPLHRGGQFVRALVPGPFTVR